MFSVFNAMAAERYRLKTGFWPLFFIIATVGVVLASSLRLEANSYGSTVAAFTWIKTFNAVLGVMICCALLRAPMTLTDSNFLRSKGDRLAYASAHVLMSLAIAAATCVLDVFATLVASLFPDVPHDALDSPLLPVWICQVVFACWAACLLGLRVGYASHRSGFAAAAVALVAFGVPGSMLALPFAAGSHEVIGRWFEENQPSGWLTVLARGELLDGGSTALLVASCAVLGVLLLAICIRRRLK